MTKTEIKAETRKAISAAFPHTLPVLAGFLALGTAYGILMQAKGYGLLWAMLMSAVAFCGSMQYAALTLLTSAFNPFQALLLSIMVNARHLFYGISMLEKYKGLGKIRGFLIYTLCDETFSIASSISPPDGVSRKKFFFFISLLDYLYWQAGTLIGSLTGSLITFDTTGLDFVLTALFTVLFLEQMKNKDNRLAGIIGIVCTLVSLFIFGPGNLVIPAMVLILLVLITGRKKLCR